MKIYIFSIVLQMIGFGVMIAEIFIPSMGILSLIALGFMGGSLYLVYTQISTSAGMVFTCLDLVLIPILVVAGMKILAKSKLSLHRELSRAEGVVSQDPHQASLVSLRGTALSDLRPSGAAMIEKRRVDVVTDGEYIESGSRVRVTEVKGNRVVVELDQP